uniref:Uncharacterized protein n=1 Tax=Romanomermis culicivorax TaxID=13658 RepID=A0A915K416_ROMCU
MVHIDVQQPQQPSTSTANVDLYRQLICKPAWYEHPVIWKTQQLEEVESPKAHKTGTIDEPYTQCKLPPSRSRTECRKTLSE